MSTASVVDFRFGEVRPKLFVYLVVEPGTPRDWLPEAVERKHVLIRLVAAPQSRLLALEALQRLPWCCGAVLSRDTPTALH